MWTCPECSRSFSNTHQWHSCIRLSLEAKLAGASDLALDLYREFEAALSACGEFRIHPHKTRISFIDRMTFAGARLARRWIDISLITSEPIDDPRIRTLECYGPTSFAHGLRITDVDDLDDDVREWLCASLRRGRQDTLDPAAHVEPLLGLPLELVVVPLRAKVFQHGDALVVHIPRYAAEVFEAHPAVCGTIGRHRLSGIVEAGGDRCLVNFTPGTLESLGFGVRERADVFLRAEL